MDAAGLRDLMFGAGGLLLLWKQNRILAEQNRIMREQTPSASGSPPIALGWRRYWPLLAMAVLTLLNLGGPWIRPLVGSSSQQATLGQGESGRAQAQRHLTLQQKMTLLLTLDPN